MNVPPPPPLVHAFLQTPATVCANVPIIVATCEGQGVHKSVTEPFADVFDGEPENMLFFVFNRRERAIAAGWDQTVISMLTIPVITLGLVGPKLVNLVLEHGSVTLNNLMNQALNYTNTANRVAQNTYHMYKALMLSITKELRQRIIMIDNDSARVNGVGNGPMLFKIIVTECSIDTPATIMRLREKFLTLDHYMATLQGDVDKFNKYVKSLVIALRARGKTYSEGDMMVALFKGYSANPDREFLQYNKRKKDEYEENGRVIQSSSLIEHMNNKYFTLIKDGKFNKPSEMDRKIMALQTIISK